MVMMPLLYTDTTAAWRLKKRRERLAVCAAGVMAEVALAIWASLLWSFLPDGYLRSMAFMLATTAWVMSIAVNMMPFMRFDGYYFLSDCLGVANLHQRSFAIAKYYLREFLFGFSEAKPEIFTPQKEKILVLYAWATWLYRFFLFTGIALLVYHAFFKVLGIFLFCVEVSVFVLLPILKEIKVWLQKVLAKQAKPRAWGLVVLLALMLGIFCVPWNQKIVAPAIIRFAQEQPLYAEMPAQIKVKRVTVGQLVKKGDVLYQLVSPVLKQEREKLCTELELAQWRVQYLRLNRETAAEVPVALKEMTALQARLSDVEHHLAALTIRATRDGIVVDVPEDLTEGEWVANGEWLGLVAGSKLSDAAQLTTEVESWAYVSENDFYRIKSGTKAHFVPESNAESVSLELEGMDHTAARHLGAVAELASPFGGPIAAVSAPASIAKSLGVDAGPVYAPKEAVYRLVFKGERTLAFKAGSQTPSVDLSGSEFLRGHVVFEGEAASLAGEFFRFAWAVVLRESGF